MTIPIIYEDNYLLIIDKPAGLIVHEGAGHTGGKGEAVDVLLTDWIRRERAEIVEAFQAEALQNKPADIYFRPGIVHRLDKDTSGLLIIAKDPTVKEKMQSIFKARQVVKEYATLVLGFPVPAQGSIETFIARNPHDRRQMAVSFVGKGKEAKTDYAVIRSWPYIYKEQSLSLSLVSATLHSGRMHQIRVQMKYKGWPIIGDQTYKTKLSRTISNELGLSRQFLHAQRLEFQHPIIAEKIKVLSPLPHDLKRTLDALTTIKDPAITPGSSRFDL